MTERDNGDIPYLVNFERLLFQTEKDGNPLEIPEANFDVIDLVYREYMLGRDVVITTAKPKEQWEQIRITLDDHGILYNRIIETPET